MTLSRRLFLSCSALTLLVFTLPLDAKAQAVDQVQVMERMDHLEHDLMLLQRQIARGEVATGTVVSGDGSTANPAQLEIRLSAIEDQLRQLRGKVEENDNRVTKVAESVDKLQKDTEFRFGELATNAATSSQATETKTDIKQPVNTSPAALEKTSTKASSSGTLHLPAENGSKSAGASATDTNFSSPREQYNAAFRLLNQTQYEESAALFDSFTKKYPKDPLVGNAFYWEGETYYIRRDFVKAADNFRKGFEAIPEGPKAPDNLLKLAMALDNLNQDKEACLVLQKIDSKFKLTAANVADKAKQEQKRIGCKL